MNQKVRAIFKELLSGFAQDGEPIAKRIGEKTCTQSINGIQRNILILTM